MIRYRMTKVSDDHVEYRVIRSEETGEPLTLQRALEQVRSRAGQNVYDLICAEIADLRQAETDLKDSMDTMYNTLCRVRTVLGDTVDENCKLLERINKSE